MKTVNMTIEQLKNLILILLLYQALNFIRREFFVKPSKETRKSLKTPVHDEPQFDKSGKVGQVSSSATASQDLHKEKIFAWAKKIQEDKFRACSMSAEPSLIGPVFENEAGATKTVVSFSLYASIFKSEGNLCKNNFGFRFYLYSGLYFTNKNTIISPSNYMHNHSYQNLYKNYDRKI